MLQKKTTVECWNILKYEIERIIDKFVPLKNNENGLERNICQKKLLEKYCSNKLCGGFIRIPERMKTANYKEALNAATTEIRQSKRSYEQKLACNIKNDKKEHLPKTRKTV